MNTQTDFDLLLPKTVKRDSKKLEIMLWSAGIALYFIIFLWGFWQRGIFALGINESIFLTLILVLLSRIYPSRKIYGLTNLKWLIPLLLIILSFALFENPFIKVINLILFPSLVLIFYNYAQLENSEEKFWNFNFFFALIARAFEFFQKIGDAIHSYFEFLTSSKSENRAIIKRVALGLIIFLILAVAIIIPLLSSADNVFASQIKSVYLWLQGFISTTAIAKIMIFLILSIFFLALSLAWKKSFTFEYKAGTRKADSIISGIVIGGILFLYLLFLFIQFRYLWVQALPVDFTKAVTLVKSGFWQLFALTVINIGIFFFTFQKTNNIVQKVLLGFTLASFLLLLSAGHRMFMYVTFYGFSYEKFYASYTVIYCAILLIWLFTRFFKDKKENIIKFVIFLFLWMYAIVSIFPLEQFVMRTNVALSKKPDSRIKMYELKMLSADVLDYVKAHKDSDLASNNDINERTWVDWIVRNNNILLEKKWYEMNLSNILNK